MQLKPKRRWSIVPIAGFLGLLCTAAFAFFLTTYLGDGAHEGKTGKGTTTTLPVQVSFAEGQLAPGAPVEVTAKLENTSGKALMFQKLRLKAETPSVPVCGEQWLRFKGQGGTEEGFTEAVVAGTNTEGFKVPAGTSNVLPGGGKIMLEFDPAKNTVDETSCENATVKVTAHLE